MHYRHVGCNVREYPRALHAGRLAALSVEYTPVVAKSLIESSLQISNLPRNGFKSFSQSQTPFFLQILNLSTSDLKLSRECFTENM